MIKILVLYYSRTGKTKTLAQEIAVGVNLVDGVEAVLRSTEEVVVEDFIECDGIIAGSPVYFGTMAAELKLIFDKFVGTRKKMGNKVGAAFTTAGDISGGKETTIFSILQAFLIYGMVIVGDPLEATGHYGVSCVGQPDEKTISNAHKTGARVAEITQKLKA